MKNYMTPDCHLRLSSEYERLRNIERPEITKVIQWAAGNGDRSENADYIYGKKRLREIDSRLRFLAKRLDSAQVINPEIIQSDTIKFGATVLVSENEQEKLYYIVGQDEIELDKNKISWRSPIGANLLGKEEGDMIEVKTPGGIKELEILEIRYSKIP